jgi:ABC-type uncharacterized transport system permease subunit
MRRLYLSDSVIGNNTISVLAFHTKMATFVAQRFVLSRKLAFSQPSLLIHIVVSIIAFGILAITVLHSFLLYLQNHSLRAKALSEGMMNILPPLQTMETWFFKILWFGFILLSVSLFSALIFLYTSDNTHYLQKTILSLLAWGLFGVLLFAHHYSGLRGTKAMKWTLIGVSILTLAYLAGKPL